MLDQDLFGRALRTLALAGGLFALAGCGGVKMVPVSGKVMLGDQPLTAGRVSLVPDRDKGNGASVACIGRINSQGGYDIVTATVRGEIQKGAMTGWYKVTILNSNEFKEDVEGKINKKFMDERTTPLRVEVIENPPPGQYDFKVSK
jgi:hypothetical protein